MSWLVAALVAPLFYSFSNFIEKYLVDHVRAPAGLLTVWVSFMMGLGTMLLGVGLGAELLSSRDALLMMLAGASLSIYILPYFIALKLDEASRIIPLFQFSPLFLFALSWLCLGEELTGLQFCGALLVIVGGFILSLERRVSGVLKLRPAFWLIIFASFLYAVNGLLTRMVISQNNLGGTLLFQGFGQLLAVAPMKYYLGKTPAEGDFVKQLNFWGWIVLTVLVSCIATLCDVYAMGLVKVNLVRSVAATQPLFVVVLGTILSHLLPGYFAEDLRVRALGLKFGVGLMMLFGIYLLYR
ncbi:MAG: EamA family transporter [Oligoflexia bacterium]|nr:EamA family transporter [Oligoflexia bacterium]